MTGWWSSLGEGVQRLLGRGRAPQPPVPTRTPPAQERPPQAWPWQAPVQRALDPSWGPALRPDDFASGLASHQDPSLRRDLVHEVRPGAGGLVDGLADLVPGLPRTQQPTLPGDLVVRPVRTEGPTTQRSLASFTSSASSSAAPAASSLEPSAPPAVSLGSGDGHDDPGGGAEGGGSPDGLTTVEVQPPWLADPVGPVPTEVSRSVGTNALMDAPESSSPPAPGGAEPASDGTPAPAEVPVAMPGEVRIQRAVAADAEETVRPAEPTGRVVPPELPLVPTHAPTVARATAGRRPSTEQVADLARFLPLAAPPAPRAAVVPDLGPARTLPSLQRRVSTPAASAPGEATAARVPQPETPDAPLSGFADAIQRLSVETETHEEGGSGGQEEHVPRPVVPARSGGGAGTGAAYDASTGRVADVQRDLVAEPPAPPAPSGSTSDTVGEGPVSTPAEATARTAPVAPLVGSDLFQHRRETQEQPPLQRTWVEDLPALPVVPDTSGQRGPDVGEVPRLTALRSPTRSAGSSEGRGLVGATAAGTGPGPVVARSVASDLASDAPVADLSTSTAGHGTTPRPPFPSPRTAPLTGTRPALVQRADLGAPAPAGSVHTRPVQPIRFEGVQVGTDSPGGRPSAGVPASSTVATQRAVQRSVSAPAVAPGLVGPGPAAPDLTNLEPVTLARVFVPDSSAASAAPSQATAWSSGDADLVDTGSTHVSSASVEHRPAYEPALQRLPVAAPPVHPAPPASPRAAPPGPSGPVRALPFDQMFGGAGPGGGGSANAASDGTGWTTVELPVVEDAVVQRAVEIDEVAPEPTEPAPAPSPEPPATSPPVTPSAGPAPAAGGPSGADLDEMARRLFDPLSARLRAELWLDRERAGLVADARF